MTKRLFRLVSIGVLATAMSSESVLAASSVKGDFSRLLGRAGMRADAVIRARAYSEWARGKMYEECERAFSTGFDDRNHGWQNEYWGKTMLCIAGAISYTGDIELKEWALKNTHEFLSRHQRQNGYICTYSDEGCMKAFSFWGRKYTLWALIELHRATGDTACLDAAVKLMDHMIKQLASRNTAIWQTGIWNGVSSMSILKPVLLLYEITNERRYLDFATRIVRAMEDPSLKEGALLANAKRKEKILEWFPDPAYWAKAYEIMSCLEGAAYYYRVTGDKRVLDEVLAFYGHLEREELNALCSAGYFDHFLTARGRHNAMTELCDVTHWIRLNMELFEITDDTKYADRMEEAFLNAFLAGVSRDGQWGAHIVRSHGTRHLSAPPQTGMMHHQCCPDNMMRTFFDMASGTVVRRRDGTVEVVFYTDGEVVSGDVAVSVSGGYPWGDEPVRVRLETKAATRVKFRVPAWSRTVRINGETRSPKGGWEEVAAPAGASEWLLSFDMSPRVIPADAGGERPLPPSPQCYSKDIGAYTVHFMEWYTPEMSGLSRIAPALRVMRGPLVLAKGRLAGTSRAETFAAMAYENGGDGWKATLAPIQASAANAGVGRAWLLTLSRGRELLRLPVSDFASVSDVDDPANWFSIWF